MKNQLSTLLERHKAPAVRTKQLHASGVATPGPARAQARATRFLARAINIPKVIIGASLSVRWPGSVKTRFAFHIELGYTIVHLDIPYFAIQGYMVYVCGHRSACAVTEPPCAVTDRRVRSPNRPVRSPIGVCGHRTALCGHRSACAVTEPPLHRILLTVVITTPLLLLTSEANINLIPCINAGILNFNPQTLPVLLLPAID